MNKSSTLNSIIILINYKLVLNITIKIFNQLQQVMAIIIKVVVVIITIKFMVFEFINFQKKLIVIFTINLEHHQMGYKPFLIITTITKFIINFIDLSFIFIVIINFIFRFFIINLIKMVFIIIITIMKD